MQVNKPRFDLVGDVAALVIAGLVIALFALLLGLAICHVFQSSAEMLQTLLPFSP